MLINEVITLDNGERWKVKEAVSIKEAMAAISWARVSGSVGANIRSNDDIGSDKPDTIIAEVVQVNSDGSERKPYTQAY